MQNRSFLKTWVIGDKRFYRTVIALLIPIVVQNTITNFVNLLDNLMIGQIGTDPMSGVSIVNQLMMVFNIFIFGALSAPGIFGAQFYGKGDNDGLRSTFRFMLLLGAAIVVIALPIFGFAGPQLIGLYLTDGSAAAQNAQHFAEQYLHMMMLGLLPFALTNAYSGTLRRVGETFIPMVAGIAAMLTNLVGNYILIFGHFGAPAMGVSGAALATVISRYVELAIVAVFAHRNTQRFPFLKSVYRSMRIPLGLAKTIFIKGLPLMVNEFLFSVGMATQTQCLSVRGYGVIAALNISGTVWNLFTVLVFATGEAVSIIVGQKLGAGELEDAKHSAWKLSAFGVACCFVMGCVMFAAAGLVPQFYNTEPEVRQLATQFIRVTACCLPLVSFTNCCYFTLRSGGKMFITFLFDSGFLWVVTISSAFILTRFTSLTIVPIYIVVQLTDLLKSILGFFFMKRGTWVNNIVSDF